jgi:3-methylcrotonyl-CoA carboxylase alpha subunit
MQIVDIAADNFTVLYESQRHQVFFSICAQQLCIEFAEKSYQLKYVRQKNITIISTNDHSYELHQSSNKTATLHNQTLETKIRAPMAATIVAVYKKTGDEVKKGDALVVLEAMKMEHTIYAPENGHLTALFFTEGQQIQDGSELLELCYEA